MWTVCQADNLHKMSSFIFSEKKINKKIKMFAAVVMSTLTHCILNRFSYTKYWKSPISILGTLSYEIYIHVFLEKNG